MAEGQGVADSLVTEFATYNDFLDSQITPRDLYYLEVANSLLLRQFYSTTILTVDPRVLVSEHDFLPSILCRMRS